MGGLIMAVQMILALSIIVAIHEFGHLITAKIFGMRVEKYFIGFPPKIFSFKYKGTEYGLGSVPLGGFVKISGIIDESFDTKHVNKKPEPWEFRAKPAWQRLIVMLGGIVLNVITGIIIFVSLTYKNGDQFISKDEINKHGIIALELGKEIGLETGDKIININGEDWIKDTDLFNPNVFFEEESFYTIERNGNIIKVTFPDDFLNKFSSEKEINSFIKIRSPFTINEVVEGSEAYNSGIKKGDKIISIGDENIIDMFEFHEKIKFNNNINLKILRDKKLININVSKNSEGKIGIIMKPDAINYSKINYSFYESIPIGTAQAFSIVVINVKAFGQMFSGNIDPRKSMSGPIGIAQIFGSNFNWDKFWRLTGLISMVLAFMNLLPIPALDGGHALFISIELLTGYKPSEKFLEYSTRFGVIILLTLMGFVIINDIYKLFI
tara:strand:+ start:1956 stop:3269 length:1314 start_codon:yes stop_codon:yes gene_type:complete